MFTLGWERHRRVLLIRFSGILVPQDISDMDLAIIEFGGLHGRSDTIYDFTETTTVAIPQTSARMRGQQPPLSPGFTRVIVAPNAGLHRMSREFAEHQRRLGFRPPFVTSFCEEAYRILGLGDAPDFEPMTATEFAS